MVIICPPMVQGTGTTFIFVLVLNVVFVVNPVAQPVSWVNPKKKVNPFGQPKKWSTQGSTQK